MPPKGFITVNHVLGKINKITGGKRKPSVPSPSAQMFHQCVSRSELDHIQIMLSSAIAVWKIKHPILAIFAQLQFETGSRVSELLGIHSSNISPQGRILVRSLKKGNPRIIEPRENLEWFIDQSKRSKMIFQDLNRFEIHRYYKASGIQLTFGKNQRSSTTHVFRHLVGLDLQKTDQPLLAIKTALGQKTDTAADHYTPPARG